MIHNISKLLKLPSVFSSSSSSNTTSQNDAILNRKRPTRLDIHVSSLAFGVPATPSVVARDVVEEEGYGYSVYCKRERMEYMEDRYIVRDKLRGKSILFDEYACFEEAVKRGYLNTDSEFMKQDLHGGCCCVTTLIRNNNLVVSNTGDCRVVISRGGVVEALTFDHRPSREDERDRIETSVSNQEAVDIARQFCVGNYKQQPLLTCKKLAELSASRGSLDDIQVLC